MAPPGFGKPKYGGGGNFAKTFKLSAGKNGEPTSAVYRIIPPIKSLAEAGRWTIYVGTHYGYRGVNPRDASKPYHKTFKCIEESDYKTKAVLQVCPECDLIAQHKEELVAAEAEVRKAGHTEDEIQELLKPAKDWLQDHNCDRKWQMNVRNTAGEYGVLHLSNKTKKKLEAKIIDLQTQDGIDAIDLDQGVWFKFTRTGLGRDTDDAVDVVEESVKDPVTGRVSRTVKVAPFTEAEALQALKECPDLALNTTIISFEQIKLLTQCSGEPEDVDRILGLSQKNEKTAVPAASKPAPEPTQRAVTDAAPAVAVDEEAVLLAAQAAALAALKAKKAAQAAAQATQPVTESKPVPATAASTPADGLPVNREAFMARFGKK